MTDSPPPGSPFGRLLRGLLVVGAALSVVIVPFAVLGLAFEERVESWLREDLSPVSRFWLLAGLLATDIALPIPSSAVSTYGGGILGTFWATLASFLGMTVGAALGFAVARWCGPPLARWMIGEADREAVTSVLAKRGPLAVVLLRPLPILAEASVLLVGAVRLSWRSFLPAVLASNLVISLVYAACGEYFRDQNALPWAVVATGTIPLFATFAARRWLRDRSPPSET